MTRETGTRKPEQFNFRLSKELRKRIFRASKAAGLAPADWCRAVLALAANRGAFAPPPKPKDPK
jgi:hypothetical protein